MNKTIMLFLTFFSLCLPKHSASAQKTTFSVFFITDFYHFNNADLQNYTPERQNETDDKASLIFSTLGLSYFRQSPNSIFELELYRSGFWGNDNLEGKDTLNSYSETKGTNPILLKRLAFNYFITPDLSLKLGRFRFSLGYSRREYLFSDTLDGIILKWRPSKTYSLSFMFDILSLASKPEESYLYSNISKDEENLDNFEGDTVSIRSGLTFRASYIKTFAFIVRYSANTRGGADRAENGFNGINQADGDYLAWCGLRIFDNLKHLEWNLSTAYSYAKDYRYSDTHIYRGYSVNLEAHLRLTSWRARLSGAIFSVNYMGMKGLSMSSFLLFSYLGLFSSPYAGAYHFKNQDSKKAKTFIDFSLIHHWKSAKISLTFLQLWDSKSWSNMGEELLLSLELWPTNLRVKLQAGLFIPGTFFNSHSSDTLPLGKDLFYGSQISCTYYFSL